MSDDKIIRLQASRLTQGERRALQAMADHGTSPRAASWLGIGAETVRSHTRSARLKLGAPTTANAVAIAFRAGVIR